MHRLQSPHPIGQLRVGILGKHIVKADIGPVQGGPMQLQFSAGEGVQQGSYVFPVQNASIGYTFVVHTKEPEELQVQAMAG